MNLLAGAAFPVRTLLFSALSSIVAERCFLGCTTGLSICRPQHADPATHAHAASQSASSSTPHHSCAVATGVVAGAAGPSHSFLLSCFRAASKSAAGAANTRGANGANHFNFEHAMGGCAVEILEWVSRVL